jgi:restriction system protein
MTIESSKAKGPAFVQWFGPLLDALRELGGSATPKEAVDVVARLCKVPQAQREETLKSGMERFANQVYWARQYLVWDGLIESGRRGIWTLTATGLNSNLSRTQALQLFERVQKQVTSTKKSPQEHALPSQRAALADDSEQADEESEQARFIAVMQGLSAGGFERLCLRLLREAGFDRLEVTGRSNDGGVDGVGVLQVNDLVSFNVVFQCKKWMNAIPPKEIRDLRGAMAGRADKAIFLTTSHFSQNAKDEAIRPGADPVELVDGEKLYAMFRKYELGLKPRTVYDIDEAFFEPFRT